MNIKIYKQRMSETKVFASSNVFKILKSKSTHPINDFVTFGGIRVYETEHLEDWTMFVPDEVYFNEQRKLRAERLSLAMENLKGLFR